MRNTARSTRKSARNTDHTPLTVLYPMGASCGSSNSFFKPFTAAWKNRSAMSVPKVSPEKRVNAWMYSLALTSAKIKCMRAVKMSTHAQKGRKSSTPIASVLSQYLKM